MYVILSYSLLTHPRVNYLENCQDKKAVKHVALRLRDNLFDFNSNFEMGIPKKSIIQSFAETWLQSSANGIHWRESFESFHGVKIL